MILENKIAKIGDYVYINVVKKKIGGPLPPSPGLPPSLDIIIAILVIDNSNIMIAGMNWTLFQPYTSKEVKTALFYIYLMVNPLSFF